MQLLAASRLMLSEIESHIQARRSFAFEPPLSGRGYLRLIGRLRGAGRRVAHGGHNVPLPLLQCRFPRSIRLLLPWKAWWKTAAGIVSAAPHALAGAIPQASQISASSTRKPGKASPPSSALAASVRRGSPWAGQISTARCSDSNNQPRCAPLDR